MASGRNIAIDPATGLDAPPNFGRQIMPHAATFSSIVTTASRAYKNPDEAVLHSLENARWMRNTCLIMECLEARQRGTALLNWHLESEDKKDPRQKKLCEDLTTIITELPDFTEYRRNLLEALWYGRYMVKHGYGYSYRTGQKRIVVKSWQPVHGDKIVFRYDDGSGKWDPNQIGIRVIGTNLTRNDVIAGDRHLEPTYEGLAYFLEPWERSLVALHKHIIEDAPYEYALRAGAIHGIGIRDRIYWTWFQMQEVLRMLMDFLQRSAQGIWVYFYPAGNEAAKLEMEAVAKQQTSQNVLVMPRTPGDPGTDGYGVDRVEVSPGGGEALKSILHDYFGHQIKRYILGQILSTESDATGLGSGVADLHLESFLQIIRYDATKLEETITRELVEPLKNFNWPDATKYLIRFKIDTEAADTKDKLAAVESAWNMGARIKESDVMDLIGFSLPTSNDRALTNPAVSGGGQPGAPPAGAGEAPTGQQQPEKPTEELPAGAEPPKPEPPKQPEKHELEADNPFDGLTPEQALAFMHLVNRKAILEPSEEAHYFLHLLGATMDDDKRYDVPAEWALALSHLMRRPDAEMELWEFDPLEAEARLALSHLTGEVEPYGKDAAGHEHKGKGPGGGQFTSSRSGGTSAEERKPQRITQTPAFKKWFGGSVVKTKDGSPEIVYHGTTKSFSQFDPQKIGSNLDSGDYGKGFYFTDEKVAGLYAGDNGRVVPVYLAIRKPFVVADDGPLKKGPLADVLTKVVGEQQVKSWINNGWDVPDVIKKAGSDRFTQALEELGYDGVEHRDPRGGASEWVAFHPNQIKSATGNRATFDPSDNRITHAYQRDTLLRRAIVFAADETDREPSEGAKAAGNYKKGRFLWHGLMVVIENPRGSFRSGTDSNGKTWRTKMAGHYGYFVGPGAKQKGADGDAVDVLVGPDPESELVFVVDQLSPDGEFDEHKVIIGCQSEAEARQLYLDSYSPGWKGLGEITPLTLPDFKDWLKSGETTEPVAGLSNA